ncbi:MAG: hypothetical protein IJJ45_07565 [Clostridia bacterium]|nr:hypothetical protein [Clostridia bacterium]
MTISGYSSAIVDAMLGWLKGFANWVLRLFHLAGSVRVSPLLWLSNNWLKLLIILMIIGVSADILVWLVRWRPHWVWFRKERVIVKDDSFFSDEGLKSEVEWEEDLEKNWHEHDYVVASTVVKRAGADERRRERDRRGAARPSTVVHRRDSGARPKDGSVQGSFQRGERRKHPVPGYVRRGNAEAEAKARQLLAEREEDLFGMDGNRPDVTDFYEDEVFNVANLPRSEAYVGDGKDDPEVEAQG